MQLDHVSHVASDWGQIFAAGGCAVGLIGTGLGIVANFRCRKHKKAKMHAEDSARLWHERYIGLRHQLRHPGNN